ncbi:conjugative transposon protein TraM [Saccharicrinis sp. GN24d3]|uniref:conjugative transposon protein TraM n=1 Tax=Saccharicrinis sp. GN24d3 TaxID=3458416 RepID=UPI0040364516
MMKLIKENKSLFVLPLLPVPFLILIFYVMGGGTGSQNMIEADKIKGANYQLPEADRNIDIMDKREAYRQMETQEPIREVKLDVDTVSARTLAHKIKDVPRKNVNEVLMDHVKKQEKAAREAMEPKPAKGNKTHTKENHQTTGQRENREKPSSNHYQKKRTDNKGTSNKKKASYAGYPDVMDIEGLEGMFGEHEKLILHNDSLTRQVQRLQQLQLQMRKKQQQREEYHQVTPKVNKGFRAVRNHPTLIKAQIIEDFKVMSGNRVMMRLLSDVQIKGKTIKANTIIYGICKTDNERLQVYVNSIQGKGEYLSVSLNAYDLDGIRGLYVPDNVARKVYKDMAGGMNASVMLQAQGNPLAYMGMDAANDITKSMFKRVRLKKVYLRKNTVLILKND